MNLSEKIIPEQKTGISIEASADVVAKTNHEAVELFQNGCEPFAADQ